jgi:hypothetical protein
VTLSSAAPVGGVTVALSSSSSKAGVPATVTIVEGATSAQFTVTTVGVAAPVNAVITGTLNGISATDTLTVTAPTVVSVTLDPTTVPGGRTSTGTVNIGYAAPAGGVVVSLASSNVAATLPASVTVAEGATKATFTITTVAVSTKVSATITATSNGTSANGVGFSQHPHHEVLRFAETMVRQLGHVCPGTMTDYLLRVDVMQKRTGNMIVNELESFEASYESSNHAETHATNALVRKFWDDMLCKFGDQLI